MHEINLNFFAYIYAQEINKLKRYITNRKWLLTYNPNIETQHLHLKQIDFFWLEGQKRKKILTWIDGFLSGEEKEGKMGRNFPSSAWQIFQEGQGYILIDVYSKF